MIRRILSLATIMSVVFLSACQSANSRIASTSLNDECVVLVHGLWRSGFAMRSMDNYLAGLGYHTERIDYPSTKKTVGALAEEFIAPAVAACENQVAGAVHIVAHSMGGILTRQFLQDKVLRGEGRVVLISTPNQGSELVETFGGWPLADWILGPAALQLTYQEGGVLQQLKPLSVDVGVIAGTKSYSPIMGWFLPAPHDGTVSLESTKLPEMKDFVSVNSNHVGVRSDDEVKNYVAAFLQRGVFSP